MNVGVLRLSALATALVAANALAGCGLFHGSPHIETAAGFLPASTTALVFTDREATAKRLDVDDINGRDATDEEITKYNKAFAEQGWGQTRLASYDVVMKDAPFNELDIRWEASARWKDGSDERFAYVWRADDDLDLGALGRSLTDNGYRKDTVHGLARYQIDFTTKADPATGLVGGMYPADMTDVLIDSDDHLVVGSGSPQALADIAAVATGDASSLEDHLGDYKALVDKAHDAEFAAMSAGSAICQDVHSYGSDEKTDPGPAYDALGHPVARALVATGDPMATTNYLEFASSADAKSDASARADLVKTGSELRTQTPFSQLGTFKVSQDGDLVVIKSDWSTGGRAAVSAELTGGGPAACLPAS